MLDLQNLPAVSQSEFIDRFDEILAAIDSGKGPYLIFCDNGNNLLLFGWDDYWLRFGCLYPDGEKERIEEECQRSSEA